MCHFRVFPPLLPRGRFNGILFASMEDEFFQNKVNLDIYCFMTGQFLKVLEKKILYIQIKHS